ncbi:DJ-1/PfpI family protein [Pseudomonas sp. NPDC090203]|jgi:protease I|uniref:DJ-1/PfpI family protein n=1 Tax=Pseudomonas sp. NPDC090203 TaxID=3364477 RepID=UPI00382FEDB1
MKTIIVVIPPKPVSGLTTCLAAWEGRLTASVATAGVRSSREKKPSVPPSAHQELDSLAKLRFDGIVLMDGFDGQGYPHHPHLLIDQLQAYDRKKKLVAAVGRSCLLLAQAGLLVGKPATTATVPEVLEALRRYGAIYQASPIVRSGWLITADGSDMTAFANAITQMLLA